MELMEVTLRTPVARKTWLNPQLSKDEEQQTISAQHPSPRLDGFPVHPLLTRTRIAAIMACYLR